MKIKAIRSSIVKANEPLTTILDRYVEPLDENRVISITSKIIALSEGRVVNKEQTSIEKLIEEEADLIAESEENPYGVYLTIKNGILIPSAGIDQSNANGSYILYPSNIQKTAAEIWHYLRSRDSIKQLGIIITDSHTTPLRRGVVGIGLGWCGFEPLYSYLGKPDLYERPLRVTYVNLLDALATSAVLVMGEGNEQTPIAIIEDAPKLIFLDRPPTQEEEESLIISKEKDLYAPLFKNIEWKDRSAVR